MFQAFDQRVVINLPSRMDRRLETEAELGRIGASAEFFPAQRPADKGQFNSIGERGAYLSHIAVWKAALGCKALLVLEDDVAFTRETARAKSLVGDLPENWEIVYFGHMQLKSVERRWGEIGVVRIDGDVEFIGLHCYAVRGAVLPRLVAAAERFLTRPPGHDDGGVMPIDGALNIARRQEGFITYAVMPPIARQRASRTDIGELKWFDKVSAFRKLVNLARRVKDGAVRS